MPASALSTLGASWCTSSIVKSLQASVGNVAAFVEVVLCLLLLFFLLFFFLATTS